MTFSAGTLIIWDKFYGTFEPEEEEVVYGVTSQPGTWNPFYINTFHYFESLEVSQYLPSLVDKIRVFLDYGPGFNYFVLHGDDVRAPPPPVTRFISR